MRTEKESISDFDLQALVDGEYDVLTHDRLMENIKRKPDLNARLEELLYQKSALKKWWKTIPMN